MPNSKLINKSGFQANETMKICSLDCENLPMCLSPISKRIFKAHSIQFLLLELQIHIQSRQSLHFHLIPILLRIHFSTNRLRRLTEWNENKNQLLSSMNNQHHHFIRHSTECRWILKKYIVSVSEDWLFYVCTSVESNGFHPKLAT